MSGTGATILVDGAKRDRWVWPGDLGISGLTAYVSTGDTLSVTNDLNTLFAHQNSAGALPYAGPQGDIGDIFSDTYHLWTLEGVIDYFLYSGDRSWVISHWPQIKKAVAFSTAKIGADGLLSVNLPLDWGRLLPVERRYPPMLYSSACFKAGVPGVHCRRFHDPVSLCRERSLCPFGNQSLPLGCGRGNVYGCTGQFASSAGWKLSGGLV